MKTLYSVIIVLLSIVLITSCGKPTDPATFTGGYKIVAKLPVPSFAQDVVIKNNYAYIAQGEGGLAIVNIKNKTKPKLVSYLTKGVRGYSRKIDIKDTMVYIAAGSFGLTIINVKNPEFPVVELSNISIKPAKDITIFGNYIYTSISENGVRITEISNPLAPDFRGKIPTEGFANGTAISNDTTKLFVACGEIGLSIYDITDFQAGYGPYPKLATAFLPGYAEAVVLCHEKNTAYIACGTKGLQIIDYSDITDIKVIGSYSTYGYAKELIYDNNKIYITSEKRGLQIIDVSNATNPNLLGVIETQYALGIDSDEKYIYVADEYEGLIIVAKK